MKITIIGAGNMGGALIKGWAKATRKGDANLDITITAHTQKTLDKFIAEYPELHATLNNKEAVEGADVIILAVKPWLIDSVIAELGDTINGKTMISVAAKAKNDAIMAYAMPNIAAEFGEAMTFILAGGESNAMKLAEELFSLVGKVMIADEKAYMAGNMMAGCGIAYIMRFVRAMMEGGVEMGLYPNDAKDIALQAMQGAVTLLNETGLHPEAAIDKVTTPGGLTIKGLNELDHSGFNSAVIKCLKAGL